MTIFEFAIVLTIAFVIVCFGGLFALLLSDKKPEAPPSANREDVYNRFMEE